MKELLFGAVFVLVYYAVVSVLGGKISPQEQVKDQLRRQVRMRSTREPLVTESIVDAVPSGHARQRFFSKIDKQLLTRRTTSDIAARLRKADIKLQTSEFLLACAGSAVGLVGLVTAFRMGPQIRLVALLIGVWLPFFIVNFKINQRVHAFDTQLSPCLTMLSNALRSGYSVHQAINVVSREMPSPLSKEFGQIMKESKLNISLEDSLRNLAQRMPSPDLDLVVTAILIQRQVGGNLGEVLDSINATIRDRIKIKGEIRTLTAQGRISGWIVGALPFILAVMLFSLNREYVSVLFTHPLGLSIIGVGLVMQVVGIMLIRRIVDVEV